MKLNNIVILEDMKISEHIRDKISVKNVTVVYQFAELYKVTSLAKLALSYIERCFAMIVETESFLELEYNQVAKIFSSSETSVHSELEISNAANKWYRVLPFKIVFIFCRYCILIYRIIGLYCDHKATFNNLVSLTLKI